MFAKAALLSASPGVVDPSGRAVRAQEDATKANALREEGDMEVFLDRWYQADMWGGLRKSPR